MDSLSKFSLLAVTIFILSLSSCQKEKQTILEEELKLPEISIEGRNTAGHYYNGNLFTLKGIVPNSYVYSASPNFLKFELYFFQTSNSSAYEFFHFDSILKEGRYELNNKNTVNISIIGRNPTREESTTSQLAQYFDGYVNILRFDSTNKIISGVYEYTFQDSTVNNGDTVRVTKGRFDLKF